MNYTSIEQSKKLLELGLSPESADMHWRKSIVKHPNGNVPWFAHNNTRLPVDYGDEDNIPCWSVGALLNVIPTNLPVPLPENPHSSDYIHTNEFELRYRFDYTWQCGYHEIHQVGDYEDILKTIFELVVWLLENNCIKKE